MKYLSLFIIAIFTSYVGFGQTSDNEKEEKLEIIEKVPIYKGCEQHTENRALQKCMGLAFAKHFEKYYNLETAKASGLTGSQKIYITFTITKDGTIANMKHKAPHPILGKEAIRVLQDVPRLTPGTVNGKAVGVKYTLPINIYIYPPTKKELRKMRKNKQKTSS